jgi:hypothetical protein
MKLYKTVGLIFAITFATAGMIFLFIPGQVVSFFNMLSMPLGMPFSPPFEPGLFHILAVAYMYVVTLLAYFMWRRPGDSLTPLLLANAKLASAALSLAAFFAGKGYLIFLANGIVDGFIGIVVLVLYLRLSKGAGNIRLALLNIHMPGSIRKKGLGELLRISERAFKRKAPDIGRLSAMAALREYATFTARSAVEAADGDTSAIEKCLYDGAREMGQRLRRELCVRDGAQFALACKILYRSIEIDLRIGTPGEFSIANCLFSQYYTPETCRIMSSMDAGLVAGLSGGAQLRVKQRITEGKSCCRGTLSPAEAKG